MYTKRITYIFFRIFWLREIGPIRVKFSNGKILILAETFYICDENYNLQKYENCYTI